MCGIIGVFNRKGAKNVVDEGLKILHNRGKDASSTKKAGKGIIGHCLHSVVGFVKQPIKKQGILAANCEIYNWKKLNQKYGFNAKNDAEFLAMWLDKNHSNLKKKLDELDGPYAFAYHNDGKLFIARDIVGIKPVWYSHQQGFSFASEKKALEKNGIFDVIELNPRKILVYDTEKDQFDLVERGFFSITPKDRRSFDKIKENIRQLLDKAIEKRIPDVKYGVLFSGGIDSTYIAYTLKQMGCDFTCYTAALDQEGMGPAEDLVYAKKIAKEFGFDHKIVRIQLKDIEKNLKTVIPLIEDSNVVKAGVALTFHLALKQAKKDKVKVMFTGLGSEEIFAGYQRHKNSTDINKECVSGLLKMYERDMYRDDVVSMYNSIEIRLPFLDKELVSKSLKVPENYKLKDGCEKYILRAIAEGKGIPKEYAYRKKRAAQYGSKMDRAIEKLTKKAGFKYKSEYLAGFYPEKNLKLAAMVSGGKDSIYAAYVMRRQNYKISCFVTMKSKNPSSYMFHTPNISLAKLQAKAAGVPILEHETEGKKEKELDDLYDALKNAKENQGIQGVVTGALYSSYQRDRVEKVCDKLGLKIFSPLWHINQETLLHELIAHDFKVIISSIAAYGLDKSWVGKEIDSKAIAKLAGLEKKLGLNVAGEGGEYESLVLDCPMFSKKLTIKKSHVVTEGDNIAFFVADDVELVEK